MFFILSELYLSGMFLMKRECLPDHLSRGYVPRQGADPLHRQDRHFPARQRTLPSPAPLGPPHALGEGREKAGSGPSLPPLATAATIRSGPRERAPGFAA